MNFEVDDTKQTSATLSSNSGNSALMSPENLCGPKEDFIGKPGEGRCFEDLTLSMGSNHDMNAKEDMLVDESGGKSCLGKFLSAADPSEMVTSVVSQSGCHTTGQLMDEGEEVKAERNVMIHPYKRRESALCLETTQGLFSDESHQLDERCIDSLKTVSGPATESRRVSGGERISLGQKSLRTCGSDCTCEQTGVCLFDVQLSYGNVHTSVSDASVTANVGLSTSYLNALEEINGNGSKLDSKVSDCFVGENQVTRKSGTCDLKDLDLLISVILKNKTFQSTYRRSICKRKHLSKKKSQKGSCKLRLRCLNKGSEHSLNEKSSIFRRRTVFSWLIHSRVISVDEGIQYRNPKTDAVVKDGFITCDGILCKCCDEVLSISEFKHHAGFKLNRPCLNLFMESGKPFTLCQLEAWSAEYKARKRAPRTVQIDEMDENDDICGCCGEGGDLICCDNCPSSFHKECLCAQEIPDGNWYCPQCTCRICGHGVNDKEALAPPGTLKCLQCDNRYHGACREEQNLNFDVASDIRFCCETCQEVYIDLQARIGFMNMLFDGFHWSLLKCINGNQKAHSAQRFLALKANCNSKLAIALSIMEECFARMVDPTTGVDIKTQVVYNWGSQWARVNYNGFYTVVLEKDDILMALASVRIHGVTVAEIPFVATCSEYRRQGIGRCLFNAIEFMLKSLKVEKIVLSAVPSTVETWEKGFGFKRMQDDEKRRMNNIKLLLFPETVYLIKPLCENKQG